MSKKKTILKAQNLCIGYNQNKKEENIANNICFDVKQGEMVCLIGKNGIGKSTLLNTISQNLPPLEGKIELLNKNLHTYTKEELSKIIGIVNTKTLPDHMLSVLDVIKLGRHPYTNWLGKFTKTDKKITDQAISKTGLQDLLQKPFHQTSDGEKQKIMIARVLAQDTPIILLDEPTAHLDIHHKIEMFQLLKSLCEEMNKTIIFSTHEVNLALHLSHSFWLMKTGSFSSGNIEKLEANGALSQLFPENLVRFDSDLKQFIIKK